MTEIALVKHGVTVLQLHRRVFSGEMSCLAAQDAPGGRFFVDGYGDSFHHDCGAFRTGMSLIGLAGGLAPSMIVHRGEEIICKSVVCDRFGR